MIKEIVDKFDRKFHNSKFSHVKHKENVMKFLEEALTKVENANKITKDEFIVACFENGEIRGDVAKDIWDRIEKLKEVREND